VLKNKTVMYETTGTRFESVLCAVLRDRKTYFSALLAVISLSKDQTLERVDLFFFS
jgi:hypothetical protein